MTSGTSSHRVFRMLLLIPALLLSFLHGGAQSTKASAIPPQKAKLDAQSISTGKAPSPHGNVRPRAFQYSPALNLLKALQAHRATAPSASEGLLPLDTPKKTPSSFPGFVQAPYISSHISTDRSVTHTAVTADFNGDGRPDLATIQEDGRLNVFLSSPSGDFLSTGISSSTANPAIKYFWLTAADMNGDGKLDIVVLDCDYSGAYLRVFLNDGSGAFGTPISLKVEVGSQYTDLSVWNIAVGDVNGDGKPDVVLLSNDMEFEYGAQGTISTDYTIQQVFLNDGTGTLLTPSPQHVYTYVYSGWLQPENQQAQLIDMNGDGKLDLVSVMATDDGAPEDGKKHETVQIQFGNGDGTFAKLPEDALSTAGFSIPIYNGGGNLTVADVNGDGYPDVILVCNPADSFTPGTVYLALNKGDGTLGPPNAVVSDISAPFISTVNAADVNADGKPDLIVYSDGGMAIYLGSGDGTFHGPVAQYVTGYTYAMRPAPADFDGDGKIDIIDIDGFRNGSQTVNKLALYRGNGDGTFRAAPALAPPGENASNFQVAAIGNILDGGSTSLIGQDWTHANADLYPDITTVTNDGKGGFVYTKGITADILELHNMYYLQPITGDLNGDGRDDLLFGTADGLSVAYSNGDGTYQEPIALNLGMKLACPVSFADLADLNQDGKKDIVLAYQGDQYCWSGNAVPSGYFLLLSQADGTFTSTFYPIGGALYQVRFIDVNHDGIQDMVLVDNNVNTLQFQVTIIPGLGNGAFDSAASSTVLSNYQITDLVPGDFNNDGNQDLTLLSAGSTTSSGYPGVLLMAGHGDFTFDPPVFIDAGHVASWGSYGDFNADGFPDLALAEVDSSNTDLVSSLVMIMNNGDGTFGASQEPYIAPYNPLEGTSTYTSYAFAVDANGDGSPDVVISGNYNAGFYLNDGGVKISLTTSPSPPIAGDTVELNAVLSNALQSNSFTGTVTFTADNITLGTRQVSNGTATFSVPSITAGTHSIKAVYSGDSTYNPASASTILTVLAVVPNFTLTSPNSLTLTRGSTTSVPLTLVANASFAGDVTVTCSGAPVNSSCAVLPTTVTLSPNSTANTMLIISAASTLANEQKSRGAAEGAALAALLLIVLPTRRYKSGQSLMLLMIASAIALTTGCSGTKDHTATTPEKATITVTATAGSLSQSQTISVIIDPR